MRCAHVAASILCVFLLVSNLGAQQTTWSPLASTGTPSARSELGFDGDSLSGFYVAFGGFLATGFPTDETWTYDGAQTWTQVFPAQLPPARGGVRGAGWGW